MSRPRVALSVVIPNHNYAVFLPDILGDLSRQHGGLSDVEIILADDASSDCSAQLAATLLKSMDTAVAEVICLPRQGRPGPVRNAGLSRARGDLLVCVDADDRLEPTFLSALRSALDENPDADLAYCDYVHQEQDERCTVRFPKYDDDLLRMQNILPPAALMRRSLWERLAGYRADTAYEDWELWLQCAEAGFRPVRVAEPLLIHRVHGQNYSLRAVQEDNAAKAAIVLSHPQFFPPATRTWARGVNNGVPWALAAPRGIIPDAELVDRLRKAARTAR